MNYLLSVNRGLSIYSRFFVFLTVLTVLFLSIHFLPLVVGGDQLHYIPAYNAVAGLGFYDAYSAYRLHTGAAEPVYFFVIWFFSSFGVEKYIVFSFLMLFWHFLFCFFQKESIYR